MDPILAFILFFGSYVCGFYLGKDYSERYTFNNFVGWGNIHIDKICVFLQGFLELSLKLFDYIAGFCEPEDAIFFCPDKFRTCDRAFEKMLRTYNGRHNYSRCNYLHGLKGEPTSSSLEIAKVLTKATKKIDVAVFNFSNRHLADLLIDAHKRRKISVRLLTNKPEEMRPRDEVPRLIGAGIEVKMSSVDLMMHHKFAIIDNYAVVHGSANWSDAFNKSLEVVIISRKSKTIEKFQGEFVKLWNRFANSYR